MESSVRCRGGRAGVRHGWHLAQMAGRVECARRWPPASSAPNQRRCSCRENRRRRYSRLRSGPPPTSPRTARPVCQHRYPWPARRGPGGHSRGAEEKRQQAITTCHHRAHLAAPRSRKRMVIASSQRCAKRRLARVRRHGDGIYPATRFGAEFPGPHFPEDKPATCAPIRRFRNQGRRAGCRDGPCSEPTGGWPIVRLGQSSHQAVLEHHDHRQVARVTCLADAGGDKVPPWRCRRATGCAARGTYRRWAPLTSASLSIDGAATTRLAEHL